MNFGKTHQNFYSVCINAIKGNKNKVMNKLECIRKIEKLSDEKLNPKKPKRRRSLTYLYNPKLIKTRNQQEPLTLQKILTTYKEQDLIAKNLENENIKKNLENKKRQEEMLKLKKNLAEIEQKKKKSSLIFDINDYKKRSLSKRYSTFKSIIEYLESNNITLNEYVNKSPFQTRPYEISKSFEFLQAIKFKNYKFVLDALKFSTDYLFCFDYYGQTCYHWAAKLGNIKMLQILIDHGKHHNQKDYEGRTPLYLAAVNNDRIICDFLVKNKANVHLRDNKGNSPADVAGSRELKYFLGDLLTLPYSNPVSKQRVASYLRERESIIQTKIKLKDLEKKRKSQEDNNPEEQDNADNDNANGQDN